MLQNQNLHPHDLAFYGLSRHLEDVFFIQIGAADGKRADPIFSFVKRYNWKGILVEPLPDMYDLLKKNYASTPGLIFENVAITEKNETREISRIPPEAVEQKKVPKWAFGISSLVPEKTIFSPKNTSKEVFQSLQQAKVKQTINCITFETLLNKHKITDFDILQIDTEGYDAKIIKQIDFSKYKPKLINFEWQWLTENERKSISKYLQSFGYTLYNCGEDMLATRKPIENYNINIEISSASSIPKFTANIVGMILNTIIDSDAGAVQTYPAQIEFVRASREFHLAIRGDHTVHQLLSSIDGKRNISEISNLTSCNEQSLINWTNKLKNMLILE